MKKLVFAIVAGATAFPAMAFQSIVLGPPQFATGGYANRGQCESALAHERNRQRADPALRGADYRSLSGPAFIQESRRTTHCELRNGRYVVVFNAGGF